MTHRELRNCIDNPFELQFSLRRARLEYCTETNLRLFTINKLYRRDWNSGQIIVEMFHPERLLPLLLDSSFAGLKLSQSLLLSFVEVAEV